jgi:hypothetical protein
VTGGCQQGAGISLMSWQIAVTNTNVYVTGRNDAYTYYSYGCFSPPYDYICGYYYGYGQPATGSVAVFGRNADGTLTQVPGTSGGCISDSGRSGGFGGPYGSPSSAAPVRCADGRDALTDARSVTASPDGKAVYVGTASGIIAYTRGAGGALTDAGCLQTTGGSYLACGEAAGLGGVYRLAITPSGDQVLAASASANGIAFLDRNTSTNALTPRAGTRRCLTSDGALGDCQTLASLGGIGDVAVSPDGRSFYAVTQNNGVLATLHPDAAPSCDSQTVSVPYQTSVLVPLSCRDTNGDTLTLSVTRQPMDGTLGGGGNIDQAARTVRYSPPLAYSGTDSFEFVATGQGVASAPARITLQVQPAPTPGGGQTAPPPQPKPRPAVRAKVAAKWKVSAAKLTLTKLTIAKATKGWKATLRCSGKHCPFRSRAFKTLRRPVSFRAGQTLELRISAPRHRAKVVRWVLMRGKTPKMR